MADLRTIKRMQRLKEESQPLGDQLFGMMGGEQGREERLNMSPLNPIGDQIIPALLAEFLTYTQSTTPTGRAKDIAETTISPYTNILSGRGGLEDYALAALPAAQYAKPIYKLGKTFAKGLGEKGAFDASSINALLEKIRKFNKQQGGQAKDNTFRDAPVPNPPGFRRRDMIGTNIRESRSQARELRHFKNKNLELEEHMLLVKQDLAKLTDPHSTARTRKEMAVRLKRNDRMANDVLSQMSLEDQKQVRRVLQKLREKNG